MYKNILFPTDLSEDNLKSATKIAQLAQKLEANVEVLHVLPKDVPPPPRDIREDALKPFLRIFEFYGVKTTPRHRYSNEPVEEILKEIDEKGFDLVTIPAERIYSEQSMYGKHPAHKAIIEPICNAKKCDVVVIKR